MEQYIAKGYTFPDQDWWEEKKADVSFLYTVEEEEESTSSARSSGEADEVAAGAAGRRERSEHTISGSKVRLDSWIEDARQELGPSASKITSLAGYVNLAYPIMKNLSKKKRGCYEGMEVKNKELRQKMDRAVANLQRTADAIDQTRAALSNARVPPVQSEPLRKLLFQKSTRIAENFELVNVLMNMIQNTAKIPAKRSEEAGQSKIFGSSVDLI